MNNTDPHGYASTPIVLSPFQKQTLASALREARREGQRHRRRPESLIDRITMAQPVLEGQPVPNPGFIL